MIEQSAKVVAIDKDKDKVWLTTDRQTTCGSCRLKQGCGTGLLEKHVGHKFSTISVKTDQHVALDQKVTVAISETRLLQGAVLMYLLPLLMLMLFAGFTRFMNLSAGLEIIFGLFGLALGFVLVKFSLRNKEDGFAVVMKEETK